MGRCTNITHHSDDHVKQFFHDSGQLTHNANFTRNPVVDNNLINFDTCSGASPLTIFTLLVIVAGVVFILNWFLLNKQQTNHSDATDLERGQEAQHEENNV